MSAVAISERHDWRQGYKIFPRGPSRKQATYSVGPGPSRGRVTGRHICRQEMTAPDWTEMGLLGHGRVGRGPGEVGQGHTGPLVPLGA